MNTTQKMIAAVAIVAVLAVAAVGAGFAYTASTSNDSNSTSSVYFILDQGDTASDYSDAFDAEIRYDSTRGIVDGADDLSEVDYDGAAAEAADDEKDAMDTVAGDLLTEIADITGYSEVDVDALEAYSASELATLLTAIKTAEDDAAETAFNEFIEAAEAFLDAYNTASIKTTYTFNAVAKNGAAVDVKYFQGTSDKTTEGTAASTAYDSAASGLATALNTATDAKVAAYKDITATKLKAMSDDDLDALDTAIEAMTDAEQKETVTEAKTAFDSARTTFLTFEKYYVLSGAGKTFTVSHTPDTAIPQYTFTVSKEGEINTTNYAYLMGIQFGDGAITYQNFTGAAVSAQSSAAGEDSVTVAFLIKAVSVIDDPTAIPFTDLTFNFEVASVA